MKTETWLNCHYKFFSAKNIIIFFVSSDDSTHLIWGWKTENMDYSRYMFMNKKNKFSSNCIAYALYVSFVI